MEKHSNLICIDTDMNNEVTQTYIDEAARLAVLPAGLTDAMASLGTMPLEEALALAEGDQAAQKLLVLLHPMPAEAQDTILKALAAGAVMASVATALEQLTEEADPKRMAAFIAGLELQTAKRKKGKPGPNFTPGKKKRRKNKKRK